MWRLRSYWSVRTDTLALFQFVAVWSSRSDEAHSFKYVCCLKHHIDILVYLSDISKPAFALNSTWMLHCRKSGMLITNMNWKKRCRFMGFGRLSAHWNHVPTCWYMIKAFQGHHYFRIKNVRQPNSHTLSAVHSENIFESPTFSSILESCTQEEKVQAHFALMFNITKWTGLRANAHLAYFTTAIFFRRSPVNTKMKSRCAVQLPTDVRSPPRGCYISDAWIRL